MRKKKRVLYSKHHRTPRFYGGDNSPDNLALIRHSEHVGWHAAFQILSPCEVARKIKRKFIPKEFDIKVSIEGGCEACPWKKKCSLSDKRK